MVASDAFTAGVAFAASLLSIPILAAGVWLATQPADSCAPLLQWPLVALGASLLLSSAGAVAATLRRATSLLLCSLVATLVLLLALAGLAAFVFAVTADGAPARPAPGRAFAEYRVEDSSGWLRRRVEGRRRWERIKECLSGSTSMCSDMNRTYDSAQEFFDSRITPLQSGCCKPPTQCGYTFVSPTVWINPTSASSHIDCFLWSNDQAVLCYSCAACKAGLIATLRKEWRRADVVLVVSLLALLVAYAMTCCAFRKAKTQELLQRYKQGYYT